MNKKINIEEVKRRLLEVHQGKVSIDESTFVNMGIKCKFIDIDYGEWWAKPNKVITLKQGHKKRGVEKSKKTFMNKYGVDNPLKCCEIKEKFKKTCLEKYGVDNPLANKNIQEKVKNTNLKKYGVVCPLQNKDVLNKVENTNLEKYGFKTPFQNKEVKLKIIETNLKKYGVKYSAENNEIKEKIKNTNLERYGVDCSMKNKDVRAKAVKTNLERYGFDCSMKNKDVATKNARNQSKSVVLKHWKTNEELVCIGSYEVKVINFLNEHRIEFEWQSKVFTMPNGKTYRPDLYLIKKDKWVEIKGYFRKDAKEKWDWFKKEYSNSELWDSKKVKNLIIIGV